MGKIQWMCTIGAFCVGSAVAGCTGVPLSVEDMEPQEGYEAAVPGAVSMRRLTQAQFRNTILDLYGDDVVVPEISEPDVVLGGLPSVGASEATYSSRGIESWEAGAFSIAEQVFTVEARRNRWLQCTPSGVVDETCAASTLREMGLHAWRRPLTEEEVSRLVDISTEAATTLDDFYDGLQFALGALLQSPHFMYRVEIGETDTAGDQQFTAYEMASRLSYFLWNTTPDTQLLRAAEEGRLDTREGLFVEASRMLESDRGRSGMAAFFDEYLQLYRLEKLSKDPTVFEHYTTLIGPDARQETLMLLDYMVFEAEMDFRELLTTRETFLTPRLAALYDIPAPQEVDDFAYVELPKSGPRAGILGHASFLALHAHKVSSSATLRGKAVRSILLCQHIPVPPVNVDTSIPEASGTTLTLRDRVAEHLEDPSCAGCHELLDPIGLGLENFDGLGRYRVLDNGVTIDPTGILDTVEFDSPRELGAAIGDHRNFPRCAVRTLGRYATGREESEEEAALLAVLTERFEHHEYGFKALVLEMIMSPLFRTAGTPK